MPKTTIYLLMFIIKNDGTMKVQCYLDLRKPYLRKNLDLRKIVATTDFLVRT